MKMNLNALPIFLLLFFCYGCRKPLKDVHNQNMLKKSLPEIKTAIAGSWILHYVATNGIIYLESHSTPGQEPIISFLTNDTVKKTNYNGQITDIYEKAKIIKAFDWDSKDSVYAYSMRGGFHLWIMKEIKNDTLIFQDGGREVTYYLTRKL